METQTQNPKKKDQQFGLIVLSVILAIIFALHLGSYLYKHAEFVNDRKAAINASIRLIEAGREKDLARRLSRLQGQHASNVARYYRMELESLEQQRRAR
jgi:hypothetical protein